MLNKHNYKMYRKSFKHLYFSSGLIIGFLKNIYEKYKNSNIPKTLKELNMLAIEEAKKISCVHLQTDTKMSKDILIEIMKTVLTIVNPILHKINNNYKNERRKCFNNYEIYIETIKQFERQKYNLIKYTLRSICKHKQIKYKKLVCDLMHYIKIGDENLIELILSFLKASNNFTLTPKRFNIVDVLDILNFYYQNLDYLISNSQEYRKYSLVFINDIIYENYGLEEEQVFAFISDRALGINEEIAKYINLIRDTIIDNINTLFHI
jgi:hypothetical protein